MDAKGKPGLAILIGNALAKKGSPKPDDESGEGEYDNEEHMKQIATELLAAIKDNDADALKDLLMEAFMCMDQS